jgi:hypothetical protein
MASDHDTDRRSDIIVCCDEISPLMLPIRIRVFIIDRDKVLQYEAFKAGLKPEGDYILGPAFENCRSTF